MNLSEQGMEDITDMIIDSRDIDDDDFTDWLIDREECIMDLDDEELKATRKLNGVAKESNIFEELKKKIREAKTEEEMLEALKETIELAIKTVDRMTEHIAEQSIRIKELEVENKIYALNGDNVKLEIYIKNNYIPKQKVKEILDKAEVMDYYTLPNVIEDLEKLLEDK